MVEAGAKESARGDDARGDRLRPRESASARDVQKELVGAGKPRWAFDAERARPDIRRASRLATQRSSPTALAIHEKQARAAPCQGVFEEVVGGARRRRRRRPVREAFEAVEKAEVRG